jgi:hypothetical protein
MAWVSKIEETIGTGRIQPTQVVAAIKIFNLPGGAAIVQIDTRGSADRAIPGKVSQTLQLGQETARQLFDLLKRTYRFV